MISEVKRKKIQKIKIILREATVNDFKKKICMIVPNRLVKGGIASVVNGYKDSKLEEDFDILYVESYKDGRKFNKLCKATFGYVHFIKILLFDKPEIVHIHSSFGPSFYRKLPFIYMASWAKIPIINHVHGSEFNLLYTNASDKKKKLVEKVWGKCTAFVALSNFWKETFSVIVPKEKIVIIKNFSIIADNIKKNNINNQVLFLGAINKMKGCYDIPEVVALIKKEIPEITFVIAGKGDIEEVKEIAKSKNVEKNLIFLGWIKGEEKDKILRESDIFFLPSYTEGMPMSILDAMGYSLPIISTKVGAIPEIVHNGENGYIYDPGDVEGFAESITLLLQNERDLLAAGNKSLEIVKEKYSLNKHILEIEKMYYRLLNN